MLLKTYQDKQRIKTKPPPSYQVSYIAAISTDGTKATLRFPDGAGSKYYSIASELRGSLRVGQKVKIEKYNGTYYIIGGL